jgi:uncharacterized protein (DUF1810 family)
MPNPRYKSLNSNSIFTAGDREQFFTHILEKQISCDMKKLQTTFDYIFNKFKKGIFIHIQNGKMVCFLPFSNQHYINNWHNLMTIPNLEFFRSICEMHNKLNGTNHIFKPHRLEKFPAKWYANNCIIRNEYPISEHETNVLIYKDMIENVCESFKPATCSFFLNKRDFPIITNNGTEPYFHIFGNDYKITDDDDISEWSCKFLPILSVCSSTKYLDIPIPTHDDWINKDVSINDASWDTKIPKCVFRGSNTGFGIDIHTNPRLKALYLNETHPKLLDIGITKWNTRPKIIKQQFKKLQVCNYYKLSKPLTYKEQSMYKYILHIDGHVAAFRLSMLFKMGSCILVCKSDIGDGTSEEWKLWFSEKIKAFDIKKYNKHGNIHHHVETCHVITVASDLSDLVETIEWCIKNDNIARQIAQNASKFAQENLQKNNMENYIFDILCIKHATYEVCNSMSKHINKIMSNPIHIQYLFQKRFAFQNTFNKLVNDTESNEIVAPFILNASDSRYWWKYNKYIDLNFDQWKSDQKELLLETKNTKIEVDPRIKTIQKTTKNIFEAFNEYFIGIKCINNVLQTCPNFRYTFSQITHNTQNNTISSLDEFVILNTEFIKGDTLSFNFKNIFNNERPLKIFYEILIQIICALDVAQQKYCFIHNDLTPWNCIIQYCENPVKIQYPYNKINSSNILTLIVKHVPVIIDYGKSHCSVGYSDNTNTIHFGISNQYNPIIIQDLFSFVLLSCYEMIHFISDEDLCFLLSFFTKDPINTRHKALNFLHKYKSYNNIQQAFTKNFFDTTELKQNLDPITMIDYLHDKIKFYNIAFQITSNNMPSSSRISGTNQKLVSPSFMSSGNIIQPAQDFDIFRCTLPQPQNILELYYASLMFENKLMTKKGLFFITMFYDDLMNATIDGDASKNMAFEHEFKNQLIECSSMLKFVDMDIYNSFTKEFKDIKISEPHLLTDPTIIVERVQRRIYIKSKIGCANINTVFFYTRYLWNKFDFFDKYLEAQEEHYDNAIQEIKNGKKQTHWIWFFFPQLKLLGKSEKSTYYGLECKRAASLYYWHPILGQRLQEMSLLVLDNFNDEMFSDIDLLKLKSCMTLFSIACYEHLGRKNIFNKVLKNLFKNERDEQTILLLDSID